MHQCTPQWFDDLVVDRGSIVLDPSQAVRARSRLGRFERLSTDLTG